MPKKQYEHMVGMFYPSGSSDYYLQPSKEQTFSILVSLKRLGEEGWRIVHVSERPNSTHLFLVLEREKDENF